MYFSFTLCVHMCFFVFCVELVRWERGGLEKVRAFGRKSEREKMFGFGIKIEFQN
jgi:hypothetical protein